MIMVWVGILVKQYACNLLLKSIVHQRAQWFCFLKCQNTSSEWSSISACWMRSMYQVDFSSWSLRFIKSKSWQMTTSMVSRTQGNNLYVFIYYVVIFKNLILELNLPWPGGSDGKASAYSAGDLGSIPGSGRSSREGKGNPLQYSCRENPMDGGA